MRPDLDPEPDREQRRIRCPGGQSKLSRLGGNFQKFEKCLAHPPSGLPWIDPAVDSVKIQGEGGMRRCLCVCVAAQASSSQAGGGGGVEFQGGDWDAQLLLVHMEGTRQRFSVESGEGTWEGPTLVGGSHQSGEGASVCSASPGPPTPSPPSGEGGAPVKLLRDRQVGPFMPSATSGLGNR